MIHPTLNRSGAVLLTIIILTIVLSVIVVGIMSINVSQVKSSQSVIDELKAEYLAQGYFFQFHQQMATAGTAPIPPQTTLDNKQFAPILTNNLSGGTNDTAEITLQVDY